MKPQATVSHIVTLFFVLSIRNKGTESVSLTDENIAGASDSSLPSFVTGSNNTLVTSVGQTIYLYCGVNNLGDRQVTWLRSRDLTILTIGLVRYTRDQRFTAIHGQDSNNWALKIVNPNLNDSGLYECQISYHDDTEKKLKMPFNLQVLESRALIVGSEDLYIHEGSPVKLQCRVVDSAGPPAYIYWYKGKEVINYSNLKHIEISYSSLETNPVSTLVIKQATPSDSGNYTCAPANYRQHSVIVNVIKGEKQAGLQEIANLAKSFHRTFSHFLLLCVCGQTLVYIY